MIKGTAQVNRNSTWHERHTKHLAASKVRRADRLSAYRLGSLGMARAEAQFRRAQQREQMKHVSMMDRLKFGWRRAGASAALGMNKLLGTKISNA